MSWLRIDDGFAQHPKVIRLVAKDRWTWIEILCYCARYRTEGVVPAAIGQVVRGASASFLGRCFELELLDLPIGGDGCFVVHDWADFNPKDPTAASRMEKRRRTVPGTDSGLWKQTRQDVFDRDNGICVGCGKDCKVEGDGRDLWNADHDPDRDVLVARGDSIYDLAFIVTRCHSCHSKRTRANAKRSLTERMTEPETEPDRDSRVGARARPVPSRPPVDETVAVDEADSGRISTLVKDSLANAAAA